jgi:hypothetical protein
MDEFKELYILSYSYGQSKHLHVFLSCLKNLTAYFIPKLIKKLMMCWVMRHHVYLMYSPQVYS